MVTNLKFLSLVVTVALTVGSCSWSNDLNPSALSQSASASALESAKPNGTTPSATASTQAPIASSSPSASKPATPESDQTTPAAPVAQPAPSAPAEQPAPSPVITQAPAPTSNALAVAQNLQTRGRAPATNYSREAFGTAWRDVDRNGCDTRNDILKRDFTTAIFKEGTRDCKVIGGTWTDPYSNESYTFDTAPSGAHIDHVVSLKDAWQMGADQWNDQTRLEFANDPVNLLTTIASLNQQKSDSNAASWLPPYRPGRCSFIAIQVAVKAKWALYVTESEKEVFVSILSRPECSQTRLPN